MPIRVLAGSTLVLLTACQHDAPTVTAPGTRTITAAAAAGTPPRDALSGIAHGRRAGMGGKDIPPRRDPRGLAQQTRIRHLCSSGVGEQAVPATEQATPIRQVRSPCVVQGLRATALGY